MIPIIEPENKSELFMSTFVPVDIGNYFIKGIYIVIDDLWSVLLRTGAYI